MLYGMKQLLVALVLLVGCGDDVGPATGTTDGSWNIEIFECKDAVQIEIAGAGSELLAVSGFDETACTIQRLDHGVDANDDVGILCPEDGSQHDFWAFLTDDGIHATAQMAPWNGGPDCLLSEAWGYIRERVRP